MLEAASVDLAKCAELVGKLFTGIALEVPGRVVVFGLHPSNNQCLTCGDKAQTCKVLCR